MNDEPLSDLLNHFFSLNERVLAKFTSTLGTMESVNSDRLKVIQLLAKKPTQKELNELFPAPRFDQKPILEELALDQVLIYCCAECGDYKCGGIFAKISKESDAYSWVFERDGKKLKFNFAADQYEAVLQNYIAGLDD